MYDIDVTLLSSDALREWFEDIVVFARLRSGVEICGTVWESRPFVLPDVDAVGLAHLHGNGR
jgi:hypothetical protein